MYGTALRVECGDRVTKKNRRRTYDVGSLSVMICASYWAVYHDEEEIFYSMEQIDENFNRMNELIVGSKLTEILTLQLEDYIIFCFSDNVKLYIDYAETEKDLNNYMGDATIFLPNGSIVKASGNQDFVIRDEKWRVDSKSE